MNMFSPENRRHDQKDNEHNGFIIVALSVPIFGSQREEIDEIKIFCNFHYLEWSTTIVIGSKNCKP